MMSSSEALHGILQNRPKCDESFRARWKGCRHPLELVLGLNESRDRGVTENEIFFPNSNPILRFGSLKVEEIDPYFSSFLQQGFHLNGNPI